MKRPRTLLPAIVAAVAAATLALDACALPGPQDRKPQVGYRDTPFLPDGKWRVHDSDRPLPAVVTPGTSSTQDAPGKAPSDAHVLFDGTGLGEWHGTGGKPAGWKVEDGAMVIAPRSGDLTTNAEFGDCQLHLEFATPDPPTGRDQGRGNSGLMMFGRYEIQILDNFENPTYADGHAGAVYGQYPPLVNASRKPGEWQTYDLVFNAPVFKDGKLETPAYVTLFYNGVLVQNHTPLIGAVAFRAVGQYSPHGPKGPITLQDHGNPVRFRNIWVRELKPLD